MADQITAGELAEYQADYVRVHLRGLCTIMRRPTDAAGNKTGPFAAIATDVPCSISPFASAGGLQHNPFNRSGVRQEASQLIAQRLIEMPVGTDVQQGDRIVKGTNLHEVRDTSLDDDLPLSLVISAEKITKA